MTSPDVAGPCGSTVTKGAIIYLQSETDVTITQHNISLNTIEDAPSTMIDHLNNACIDSETAQQTVFSMTSKH